MKILIIILLIISIMTFNSLASTSEHVDMPGNTGTCLDQDVWVYIKHQGFYELPSIVVVHVPKYSLTGNLTNCPAEDTKVLGQGRAGMKLNSFAGMHIVILKKGRLNSPKNYTTKAPKKIKVPDNNINTWHVNK